MSTPAEEVDINALVAKSLLNRASMKAKAKSWLQAELPSETEESEPQAGYALTMGIESDDELEGVGAPKKSQVDVLANRNSASVNDKLRKTLMGKKAYSKFQNGQKNGFEASKPMPKQMRQTADDYSDEDEGKGKGKGRSSKMPQKRHLIEENNEDSRASSKSKKRPSSYADEVIASRASKKKAKVRE